jgi:hypothetical protein
VAVDLLEIVEDRGGNVTLYLGEETINKEVGVDLLSSRAQISGCRGPGNLGDPPVITGLDLRFDDRRRSLHLDRTLYRLHMALASPYPPVCGENNTVLCTNIVVLDALAHLACADVGVIWKVRSTLSNRCRSRIPKLHRSLIANSRVTGELLIIERESQCFQIVEQSCGTLGEQILGVARLLRARGRVGSGAQDESTIGERGRGAWGAWILGAGMRLSAEAAGNGGGGGGEQGWQSWRDERAGAQ